MKNFTIEQIKIFPENCKMTIICKNQEMGTKIIVINHEEYEAVAKAISGKGKLMALVKKIIKEA
jgi:hypothetical protein